jgi:plastocyanin
MLLCAMQASAGSTFIIDVDDNFFAPDNGGQFTPTVGIRWEWNAPTTNKHNVRQDDRMFRSGPPTKGGQYEIIPPAGTYRYYCEVHGNGVMDGVLRMTPSIPEIGSDDLVKVTWTSTGDTFGDRFDVRYAVGNGPFKPWLTKTERRRAPFGKDNKPLDVKPNQEYRFRARTRITGENPKVSEWSPVVAGSADPF